MTETHPVTLFVGREAELKTLYALLDAAITRRQAQFMLVQGDYGVGKTALVEHFLAEAQRQHAGLLVSVGRCAMETESDGLIPFSQLFAGLTEQGLRWHMDVGKLIDFAMEVAPAWLDIVTAGVAGALVTTLKEARKLAKPLQSAVTPEMVFAQFTAALKKLAAKQPLALFIDDLQWADESSLKLFYHLASHLRDQPILLIGSFRPVEAMETGTYAREFREIRANMRRLGAEEIVIEHGIDVARYIARRYPCNTFPPDLAADLQERTEGYALLVSQAFSYWEERGVVRAEPGADGGVPCWALTGEIDLSTVIRSRLGDLLSERIRLMEKQLQDILIRASVEGEDFTAQTIIALLQLDELDACDQFDELVRHYHLVAEQGSERVGAQELDFYRFVHRFIQQHIYSEFVHGPRRRILHRQVGEMLEQLYEDREPIAARLARHFEEGADRLKAAHYALLAARHERSRYALVEAARWCARGLELAANLPPDQTAGLRFDLLEQQARVQYLIGDFDAAAPACDEAIALAETLPVAPERLASLLNYQSATADEQGAYQQALEAALRGKQLLEQNGLTATPLYGELRCMEGFIVGRMGEPGRGLEIQEKALAEMDTLPQTAETFLSLAACYNGVAVTLDWLNRPEEALRAYRQCIDYAERVGDKVMSLTAMLNMTDSFLLLGRFDEGVVLLDEAIALARRIGDMGNEAYAYGIKGAYQTGQGRPAEAVTTLQTAVHMLVETGGEFYLPYAHADLAEAYLAAGDRDAARQSAAQGMDQVGEDPRAAAYCHMVLGKVAAAFEEWAEAAGHFETAITMREEGEDPGAAARVKRAYAEMSIHQGETGRAVRLLEEALAIFTEYGLAYDIRLTQELLDRARHADE